jgi:hypothetical protein
VPERRSQLLRLSDELDTLLKDGGTPFGRCRTKALEQFGFCVLTSSAAFRREEVSLIFSAGHPRPEGLNMSQIPQRKNYNQDRSQPQ